MIVVASAGRGLRRDHVVAACLAGAVVIVVGYASGIGLKTTTASGPAPSEQAPAQAAPAPEPVLPNGNLPPAGAVQPMPPVPDGGLPPADAPPPEMPMPDSPTGETPAPTGEIPPPSGAPAPPSPPETPPQSPVPTCQPGAVQPVLDTVSGLPLVGGITAGAGLTGPDGILAALLGSCPAPSGTPVPSSGG
ncbi:hypothetical protein [Amycolatopsis sp. WGS_07]|uniref:hypothetical protein n=1 Tax=Amycolatopsis sp. WGS_07 TaxID=3076764 RepID=UPI003872F876